MILRLIAALLELFLVLVVTVRVIRGYWPFEKPPIRGNNQAAAVPPADPPMPDQVAPDPHLDARLMLELTFWDIGAAKTLIGTMIMYEPGRATYWMIVESCTEILYAGKNHA